MWLLNGNPAKMHELVKIYSCDKNLVSNFGVIYLWNCSCLLCEEPRVLTHSYCFYGHCILPTFLLSFKIKLQFGHWEWLLVRRSWSHPFSARSFWLHLTVFIDHCWLEMGKVDLRLWWCHKLIVISNASFLTFFVNLRYCRKKKTRPTDTKKL